MATDFPSSSTTGTASPPKPRHDLTYYTSPCPGALGHFALAIHGSAAPTGTEQPTRVLNFRIPNDSLEHSDVIDALSRLPLTTIDERVKVAAEYLLQLTKTHSSAAAVPIKDVAKVYTSLLSVCENVEMIEVPIEWKDDFDWEDGFFPKVDKNSRRVIEGLRFRWGKDPWEIKDRELTEEDVKERNMEGAE